ncbi:TetR/AcrR family transcriptional regulator [Neorhizobium sp. P12A]|uniref:TetR/AcrR family transcriptional regulator n=1 Tax=Neorhizobium sp. P12A TaxID=2268027 RepID=UPI0011EC3E83|nr:TetR/AcrR family transcriptional regulator [Neorhizobium sp. P12A]KAA0691460.1 TetR/AcrR family transcriptional regulator [Neorhizobium sp. P12A]
MSEAKTAGARRKTTKPVSAETVVGEVSALKPRLRDAERTSTAILAAATKEFAERGYGGARVDAIAARANINKRMLYHYFGGKDALYVAVLEGSYIAIRSAEARLDLSHRAPRDGMRELVVFTWQYFLAHPEFLGILSTENLHKAKFLKRSARIFELHSPLVAEISGLLDRGAAGGDFRPGCDPVKIYMTIAALGSFFLTNRWTLSTIFRRNLSDKAEIEAWGEHIVEVIFAYLRP